ncbi:MAG: aspartate/glutamate racemase family protein [Solirubrobacterales bacterium]
MNPDTLAPPPNAATAPAHRRFKATEGQVAYGISIGILMLEANVPFVPGDVGNASTYDFPVQYRLVPEASGEAVVSRQDPALTPFFVEAAEELEAQGVRAITSDCAYVGAYQEAIAEAVDIPVFISSLLQVPMLVSMFAPSRKLAVLVANGASVSDRLLEPVGIVGKVRDRCVIRGLEDKEAFTSALLAESGELDQDAIEAEIVETAVQMVAEDPSIAAFHFECSAMPPYSAAVQAATGLPTFDWIGFINYVHHAVVRRPYHGFI